MNKLLLYILIALTISGFCYHDSNNTSLAVSNTLEETLRTFEGTRSARLLDSEPVTLASRITWEGAARIINSEADTLQLNTKSSVIYWKGTKINGKHEGIVRLQEGYLVDDGGRVLSGGFTADMNSIGVTDIPAHEPVPRKRLRDHLKSEDFFYTEKYPTAHFEIKEIREIKNDNLLIVGLLSIRNVTKEIQIEAKRIESENGNPIFTTFFVIDRFEWNVAYQGSFWKRITSIFDNNFVDGEIELRVELYFHKI